MLAGENGYAENGAGMSCSVVLLSCFVRFWGTAVHVPNFTVLADGINGYVRPLCRLWGDSVWLCANSAEYAGKAALLLSVGYFPYIYKE